MKVTITLHLKNCIYMGGGDASQVALMVKNPPASGRHKRLGFDPWVGKILWRRAWQSTPVSWLENLMDRGAWWATVPAVAKSRTWMEWLGMAYIYLSIYQCRILASKWSHKQKLFCHYILQRSSSEEDQDWDWGLLTPGVQCLNLVLRWPKDSGSPLDIHSIKTDPRWWGTK